MAMVGDNKNMKPLFREVPGERLCRLRNSDAEGAARTATEVTDIGNLSHYLYRY